MKAVYQICPKGDYIIEKFDSVNLAAKAVGVHPSCITVALRTQGRTSGGYKWEYANEKTRQKAERGC